MQSCADKKEKKDDKQTSEVKLASGYSKCGDDKIIKGIIKVKDSKCEKENCGKD